MAIGFSSLLVPLGIISLVGSYESKLQESLPVRHPSHFGCEALDMIFFPLEVVLRDEERKVAVLDTHDLDTLGKESFNLFPYRPRPRLEDVAARDIIVTDHATFCEDLLVPFG